MVVTRSRASISASSPSKRKATSSPKAKSTTSKASSSKETLDSDTGDKRPKATSIRKPRSGTSKPTPAPKFAYDLPYNHLCLRTNPHLYRTGIGEQGVLMVEPYKSEILPHWRFKNPPAARESSSKLYSIFCSYLEEDDFVGADMTRKFIQMGYTRARRYSNHKGGKKYIYGEGKGKDGRKEIPRLEVADQDAEKVEAAKIFKWVLNAECWGNEKYVRLREEHLEWAREREVPREDGEEVREALLKDPAEERVVRKW
ncbi:hypothetical protein NDA14_007478 [Ustilago hordei]|nr:hypothetical protein NDA14_007478 [Ustilago hordei]